MRVRVADGPERDAAGAHNSLLPGAGHPHSRAEVALTLDGAPADAVALQVNIRRVGDALQVDWTYDACRLDGYSVEEMAEQFGLALIEITSDAGAPL